MYIVVSRHDARLIASFSSIHHSIHHIHFSPIIFHHQTSPLINHFHHIINHFLIHIPIHLHFSCSHFMFHSSFHSSYHPSSFFMFSFHVSIILSFIFPFIFTFIFTIHQIHFIFISFIGL